MKKELFAEYEEHQEKLLPLENTMHLKVFLPFNFIIAGSCSH